MGGVDSKNFGMNQKSNVNQNFDVGGMGPQMIILVTAFFMILCLFFKRNAFTLDMRFFVLLMFISYLN